MKFVSTLSLCGLSVLFTVGCDDASESSASSDGLCEQAAAHMSDCFGQSADTPQGCDTSLAQSVLKMNCSEVAAFSTQGKEDGFISSFLCGLGMLCQCSPSGPDLAMQIIDTSDKGFTSGGPWSAVDGGGYENGGFFVAMGHHGASASWTPTMTTMATYHIEAYIPVWSDVSSAEYVVKSCDAGGEITVNQQVSTSGWVSLGDFELSPGAYVSVSGQDGDFVAAAMRFERLEPTF